MKITVSRCGFNDFKVRLNNADQGVSSDRLKRMQDIYMVTISYSITTFLKSLLTQRQKIYQYQHYHRVAAPTATENAARPKCSIIYLIVRRTNT